MAISTNPEGMLIVPQVEAAMPESFINLLMDREIGAFLVMPTWIRSSEFGQSGLGVRVTPGTA